jgi:hypothetical protein
MQPPPQHGAFSSQELRCRLTLRCTRSATAGFARFRTRVSSNVRPLVSKQSPWQPRELLEEHPWSLLSNVGLSDWHIVTSQLVWVAGCVAALSLRHLPWFPLSIAWFVGAWSLLYIALRLGGNRAYVFLSRHSISSDSIFQARLACDLLHLVLLSGAAAELVFGPYAFSALFAAIEA